MSALGTSRHPRRFRSRQNTTPALVVQPQRRPNHSIHEIRHLPEAAPYEELLDNYDKPDELSIAVEVHERLCGVVGDSGDFGEVTLNLGDGISARRSKNCGGIGKAVAVCGSDSNAGGTSGRGTVAVGGKVGVSRDVFNYRTVNADSGRPIVEDTNIPFAEDGGRCNRIGGPAFRTLPAIPIAASERVYCELLASSESQNQLKRESATAAASVNSCAKTTMSSTTHKQGGDRPIDNEDAVSKYEKIIKAPKPKVKPLAASLKTKSDGDTDNKPTVLKHDHTSKAPATEFVNVLEMCLKSRTGSDIAVPVFKFEKVRSPLTAYDANPVRSSLKPKTGSDINVHMIKYESTSNHPILNDASALGASLHTIAGSDADVPVVTHNKTRQSSTKKIGSVLEASAKVATCGNIAASQMEASSFVVPWKTKLRRDIAVSVDSYVNAGPVSVPAKTSNELEAVSKKNKDEPSCLPISASMSNLLDSGKYVNKNEVSACCVNAVAFSDLDRCASTPDLKKITKYTNVGQGLLKAKKCSDVSVTKF